MSNTLIPTFHGDFQAREINIKKTFWGLEVKLTPSFPPPTHGFGLWRIFFLITLHKILGGKFVCPLHFQKTMQKSAWFLLLYTIK